MEYEYFSIKDGKLDYSNLKAVRLLNSALLLKEFNLKVEFPDGYLCPTVPNRTGYIKQIEFILYEIFKLPKTSNFIGIDIGTGTCCIYPLIGCSRNENWNFIATDVEDEIIKYAQKNLEMNPEMGDRIQIIKNPDSACIFPKNLINLLDTSTSKFILCNPPFYTDLSELESRRAFKRHKPTLGRWEMSQEELGSELGGEVGFIKKMIQESIRLNDKNIKLFSCMLGMKESLNQLIEHFKQLNLIKYFAFELLQIKHTCRYLLFWSFEDEIAKDSNHRIKITAKNRRSQTIEIDDDVNNFNLNEYIEEINSLYGENAVHSSFKTITITHNKWSRKYRRSPLTAPPLPKPIKIAVQQFGNDLIFSIDEEDDWEIFLSFINHLRK